MRFPDLSNRRGPEPRNPGPHVVLSLTRVILERISAKLAPDDDGRPTELSQRTGLEILALARHAMEQIDEAMR